MLSLTKYEIGNNNKGQVLGSVWVEGDWGMLTISDSKSQLQCMPYALERFRAGVLGA